jgi:hypothetical protein
MTTHVQGTGVHPVQALSWQVSSDARSRLHISASGILCSVSPRGGLVGCGMLSCGGAVQWPPSSALSVVQAQMPLLRCPALFTTYTRHIKVWCQPQAVRACVEVVTLQYMSCHPSGSP